MKCPVCQHDNIEGVDCCDHCSADLTDGASVGGCAAESGLLSDRLAQLGPAKPITVTPRMTVADAIKIMSEKGVGCVLVAEGDKLLGVFTERDVLRKVAHRAADVLQKPVGEFMTCDPESLSADAPIGFAVNLMAVGGYRHVPIVENGKLEGIISVRDVMTYMSKWFPDIAAGE
ncbi:MAG: CBS domain-containing protein [Planctomycetes bacterium]|nr:CBS domain-containing protein [Planctomycetota bacterium]